MNADKLRKRVEQPLAMMGSPNAGERENARSKLGELLARHGKNWNDVAAILAGAGAAKPGSADPHPGAPTHRPSAPGAGVNVLDLVREISRRHLYLNEHEHVAFALWCVHTFVFDRFAITPRLVVLSPVRGCGKSTVLSVAKSLSHRSRKIDHVTSAALYRYIQDERPSLMLDEGDNQDLLNDPKMRAVLNSGHARDGNVGITIGGRLQTFRTFAPLALAAIGRLPLPLMQRAIVLDMERSPVELERFDPGSNVDQYRLCDYIRGETLAWAHQAVLNPDPAMPKALRNRAADNWRVLVAIADAVSPAWGTLAREAAVALSGDLDEDLAVALLVDIRSAFNRNPKADRLTSAAILADLIEQPHGLWSDWRGLRDDQAPRPMSPGELARALAPFRIRPQTVWSLGGRETRGPSSRGFYRRQFEQAWASYCDTPGKAAPDLHVVSDAS